AFEHILTFFVEAGNDRIVVLEVNQQRRQWNAVVSTIFPKARVAWHLHPRNPVDFPEMLDPGAVFPFPVFGEEASRIPDERRMILVFLEALLNAVGQRLFDLRKLILFAVL